MEDNDSIRTTWAKVRRQRHEIRTDVARRQSELAVVLATEAKLARAEEALRALLDPAPLDDEIDDELHAAVDPLLDGGVEDDAARHPPIPPAFRRDSAGDVISGEIDPPRKHIRSGAMVVEAVKAGGGVPVHREQVLRHFEEAGATGGMKNPRNAVNAALNRAVNDHHTLVQISPDTFLLPQNAPTVAAFMSPEGIAADRLSESAEESS